MRRNETAHQSLSPKSEDAHDFSRGHATNQNVRDHTFFLDGSGLKILEPGEVPEMGSQSGEVVSLADWSDATLTSLRPHELEPT